MISALRTLIWFAVLTVALVVAVTKLPGQFNRVQVPPGYEDQGGLVPMTSVWLAPPPYAKGDVVAYRTGSGPEDVGFGVVRALGGARVQLVGGTLLIDGDEVSGGKVPDLYRGMHDVGPLTVPAGHLYVVSAHHQRDSLALGPISLDQTLGTVRE